MLNESRGPFRLCNQNTARTRAGAIIALSVACLVLALGFAAFSIDIGYIAIAKAELQAAADAAALAAVNDLFDGPDAVYSGASTVAAHNTAANKSVVLGKEDVVTGTFDLVTHQFTPGTKTSNAVKVTARLNNEPLFFAPAIDQKNFSLTAEAIAMLNPRDIVFVVDLSGSMNDDTEPVWATDEIDALYASQGYSGIGSGLMQDVYDDFGYGTFPGVTKHLGEPLGITLDAYAFAEMTKDDGPLACADIDAKYRILEDDDEWTRKEKGYSWIIDNQIATLMPGVVPTADSDTEYDYWERYIDYIVTSRFVGTDPGSNVNTGGSGNTNPTPSNGRIAPPSLSPRRDSDSVAIDPIPDVDGRPQFDGPAGDAVAAPCGAVTYTKGLPRRGSSANWDYVPPNPSYRLFSYNNPNKSSFPGASTSLSKGYNKVGYLTYVQFMMDLGRDRSGNSWGPGNEFVGYKSPLSIRNPLVPLHKEATAGGAFSFPPREQPMHAVRRSLIAALDAVRTQNAGVSTAVADRVSIVTFDASDAYHTPSLRVSLTHDYASAMLACTTMQPVGDIGKTTATENGLVLAREHLELPSKGGAGRAMTKKVIILLSDGIPNVWQSSAGEIASGMSQYPSVEYYNSAYQWYNSVLVQSAEFQEVDKGSLYPIGMGLGADLDFSDRIARISKTDNNGQSPRGAGGPLDYESRLTDIFKNIITTPGSRLVK
jgi:Flp pilus assembly protein TadG